MSRSDGPHAAQHMPSPSRLPSTADPVAYFRKNYNIFIMDRLTAVATPVRREILQLVWNTERPAGEIAGAFDVTFGAVSQHLRILREAGLVEVRREGRHRFYRARKEAMGPIRDVLEAMWVDRLRRLKGLAEDREEGTRK